MDGTPRALSNSEVRIAHTVKKAECRFYGACLDHAIQNEWEQFGCDQCRAYQEIDAFQKMQDLEGLQMMQFAADHAVEFGSAGRKRGVKPGAEAKGRKRHLHVVTDEDYSESESSTPSEISAA